MNTSMSTGMTTHINTDKMVSRQITKTVTSARIMLWILFLCCVSLASLSSMRVYADNTAYPDNATSSNHITRGSNQSFFVLADKSYGSNEVTQVRLEMPDVNAVQENAGVDIAVYKVPDPIKFLQAQQNLHRINVKATPAQDGVWNSIVAIWDYIHKTARQLVRTVFSEDARQSTVSQAPDLHVHRPLNLGHPLAQNPAYKPLVGFEQVAFFRYPLQFANDIAPIDAKLTGANVEGDIMLDDGSSVSTSSEEEETEDVSKEKEAPPAFSNGNVYVPLGKLAPGLYLVEAMLDEQRAVTMVFVGDTVAVTKIANNGMFVWAVNRQTGEPVANVQANWTDGVGVLATGATSAQGWLQLNHAAPEQTYIFAKDPQGGVLISENYYYDSEIYNTKLYATTDHPLYRPGDTVNLKVVGREFVDAKTSKPLADAPIKVEVFDPNGTPVASQTLQFAGLMGGDTAIKLPTSSSAGGYEIQLTYLGEVYSAAFRVADFQKPHFEINLNVKPQDLKAGQAIPVQIQMRYPDGKPVKNATVDVDLKAQAQTIVAGDLGYGGLFPVKLTSKQYQTDGDGNVDLKLPEAKEPSRYTVSILATDGAAYRVRHTQELLIDRAVSTWQLSANSNFSTPNQAVSFKLQQVLFPDSPQAVAGKDSSHTPKRWKLVRLEDQTETTGDINTADLQTGLTVNFSKSGSYTLYLLSDDNRLLGATSHWVSGTDLKVPAQHIEIVWDKNSYNVGETATALVSFSEPIDNALVTLERDQIMQKSLLNAPESWLSSKRIAPQQWRISTVVSEDFAPNVTLSVAYVKNNQFVFENAGILVANPKIAVTIKADKAQYLPGDKVTLSIDTRLNKGNGQNSENNNQPIAAQVTLGVVDEMIYVLQPEIAPNINDFFYHPRRDSVRTQVSQSFIGYDLSTNQLGQAPTGHHTQERATKVLERPRRDDVDTALWAPKLMTDNNGHATISFIMPDSLTRWRITARAMSADGVVGQNTSSVLSQKDFYIKWTSPTWLRDQDSSMGNIALFNQTDSDAKVHLTLQGALSLDKDVTLKPGINFVDVARTGKQTGALTLQLSQNGQVRDSLSMNLSTRGNGWLTRYSQLLSPQNDMFSFAALPADASNITLRYLSGANAAFYQVADDLIEQPYGCAEQTSSRLIPLSIVYQALPDDDARKKSIARQLYTHRLRLASMAGDEGTFGWWGQGMTTDPFITTYAFYADWRTTQALHISLPSEHWESLSQIYSDSGYKYPVWQRALMLDWMQQMGLPVGSQVTALANDINKAGAVSLQKYGIHDSLVLTDTSKQTLDMAVVLTQKLLAENHQSAILSSDVVNGAVERLRNQNSLLATALLLRTDRTTADSNALLAAASSEYATIDRALMLTWLAHSLSSVTAVPVVAAVQAAPTVATTDIAVPTTTPPTTTPPTTTPPTTTLPTTTPSTTNMPVDGVAAPAVLATVPPPTVPVTTPKPEVKEFVMPKGWRALKSSTGNTFYRWTLADALKKELPSSFASSKNAILSFDSSRSSKQSNLSASLERTLYLLKRQEDGSFETEVVDNGDSVRTDALYLEKLVLTPKKPLQFMVIESMLPAGATLEPSTWGIKIKDMEPLPRASFQDLSGRYAEPVGDVSEQTTIQHLIRFSQRGQYQLPAARAYNMYSPDKQVLEANPRSRIVVK